MDERNGSMREWGGVAWIVVGIWWTKRRMQGKTRGGGVVRGPALPKRACTEHLLAGSDGSECLDLRRMYVSPVAYTKSKHISSFVSR